jgi:integrase
VPKLTKTVVEKAKPDPDGGDEFLWDTALPGFGVRIYPSGTRKYFVQYRTKDNRQRRMVLGQHGVLTAENAREMAHDVLVSVSKGGDPAEEKKAARMAPTVRDLATDYLENHAIPKKHPASVTTDKAMLDKAILPKLGNIKISAVSRPDIEKLHISLRGKPYAANRVLALLSKMFSLACEWGWRADNPVKGIPRFDEDRRQRWLSEEELARLWAALEQHTNRRAANAVKLMLLTGSRRNEVLSATWDEFDMERGRWTKPSHHTKQKRTEHVPLSRAAIALLSAMQAEADAEYPFLFPGNAPEKPLGDIKKFWHRVRQEVGIEDVRLHDLRHTYASNLVSRGVSLHIVGRLLGHTQSQTTARYAHVDDVALREATETFGRTVEPGVSEAKVIPLEREAKEPKR